MNDTAKQKSDTVCPFHHESVDTDGRNAERVWARAAFFGNMLFFLLFFLILSFPLGVTLTGRAPRPVDIIENRVLVPAPDFSFKSFTQWPSLLDAWFRDHLAFRSQLVGGHIRIWERMLGSPVHRLLTGRNGEMFPQEPIAQTVMMHQGLMPLSPEYLSRIKLGYTGTQAWFRLRNIHYCSANTKYSTIVDGFDIYSM